MKKSLPAVAVAAFLLIAVGVAFVVLVPKRGPETEWASPVEVTRAPVPPRPAPSTAPVQKNEGPTRMTFRGAGDETDPGPRAWVGTTTSPDVPAQTWQLLAPKWDGEAFTANAPYLGQPAHILIVGISNDETRWYADTIPGSAYRGQIVLKPRPVTAVDLSVKSSHPGPLQLRLGVAEEENHPENLHARSLRELAYPQLADSFSGEAPLQIAPGEPTRLHFVDPWIDLGLTFSSPASLDTVTMPLRLDVGTLNQRSVEANFRGGDAVELVVRLVDAGTSVPIAGMIVEHAQLPAARAVSDDQGVAVIHAFDSSVPPNFFIRPAELAEGQRPIRPNLTPAELGLTPAQIAAGRAEHTIAVPLYRWLTVRPNAPADPNAGWPACGLQVRQGDDGPWLDVGVEHRLDGPEGPELAVAGDGLYRAVLGISCIEYQFSAPVRLDANNPEATVGIDRAATPPTRSLTIELIEDEAPVAPPVTIVPVPAVALPIPCAAFPIDERGTASLGEVSEGPLRLRIESTNRTQETEILIDATTPRVVKIDLGRL